MPDLEPLRARVLLVARDRRYRAVASMLLSRRGNTVLDCGWGEDVTEIALRERIDVVLFDASASLTATARDAARLAALDPPIGIVAVSEQAHPGLAALPVLPKWTAFEEVFVAIESACPPALRDGVARGGGPGPKEVHVPGLRVNSFAPPRLASADS